MNRAVLIGVLLITALHAFDEMVLVIALPAIAEDLGADTWYGLFIAGYVLASIVGMAWSGKQMDRSPPLKILYVGAAFFASGLLLGIVSQGTASFLVARLLQGVGGGIGWTLSFGLISLLSPPDEKPRAVAAMDVAWIVPSLMAPLIGGYFVDYMNWRWIFVLQYLPLALAMLLVTPKLKHLTGNRVDENADTQGQLGVLGDALVIALGFGVILYVLGKPLGGLWIILLPAAFVIIRPLSRCMPAGWLRLKSPLSAALLMAMMGFMTFYGMEAYQPLYLIDVRGLSTLQAGLVMTVASLSWMSASQLTARKLLPWNNKLNYSEEMLLGVSFIIVSFILQSFILFELVSLYWSYLFWALAGFGMGVMFNTARSTAMENTPKGQEGFVAGAVSLSVSLGLSLATGICGAVKNQVSYYGGSLNQTIIGVWLFSMLIALLIWGLLFSYNRKLSH